MADMKKKSKRLRTKTILVVVGHGYGNAGDEAQCAEMRPRLYGNLGRCLKGDEAKWKEGGCEAHSVNFDIIEPPHDYGVS